MGGKRQKRQLELAFEISVVVARSADGAVVNFPRGNDSNPDSPFYNAELLQQDIGLRHNAGASSAA